MTPYHEIRADYDEKTIVVYQAFPPQIADAAVKAQRFARSRRVNEMGCSGHRLQTVLYLPQW